MALTDEMSNWINGLTADGRETLRTPIRTVAEDVGLRDMEDCTDDETFLCILAILSDRIEREYFSRPCGDDGLVIKFGDKVCHEIENEPIEVYLIKYTPDLIIAEDFMGEHRAAIPYGSEFSRYIPDTQERINADIQKDLCAYWGVPAGTHCRRCYRRASSYNSCGHSKVADLLRRQRELDGVM
jgi:hypothetical protein